MNIEYFYVFLFVHIVSLVTGLGAVLVIDTFGLLWLLKKFNVDLSLVRRVANITQRLIWLGYSGMILSGIPMLMIKGHVDNLTKIKLFLVLMVGLNGVFLHFIKKSLDALGDNIQTVPAKIYFRIGLASFISQLGWWGATFIGYYHRHISSIVFWPHNYEIYIALIIFVIGTAWTIGELVTNKKSA